MAVCCGRLQAQQLSFSPMRLFFKGAPGENVSEALIIANTTAAPYEFLVSIQDWNRDSLGVKHYFPANTLPRSNAQRIRLPQTSLVIAPGETKTYLVTMQIPPAGTQHTTTNSMLFFTQTNARRAESGDKSGIGLKISLEFGIQLFYTPGTAEKGTLRFLAFNYDPPAAGDTALQRLAIRYQNTGSVHKDGFVRFELTNKQTGAEIKPDPIPFAIMPLSEQVVYCRLNDIPEGDYLAVAILDTKSDNDLKVAEKNIHVKK
ncbi:hypothetical protein [Niabella beijingensis]|uniref:COG1470 family protein n=1 Tax=Niabella beijingensis TaxID=2872700 RepID=UPI001CBC5CA0|nr:hypothetical protein [Niabella beijingensis]MBZ4189111.1 hypothetical protein [Niabella beijingensis]